MDDDDEQGIELRDFISALRRELHASSVGSVDEPLRFAIHELELELELQARRVSETKAGGRLTFLKFWVIGGLTGSAEHKRGDHHLTTQRVKLKLKPVLAGERNVLVNDEERDRPGP